MKPNDTSLDAPTRTAKAVALDPTDLARLRPFAKALLGDEHAAEDVLQDAWLRSAERHPKGLAPRQSRAWARTTVERLASNRRRSNTRRDVRERRAARPEGELLDPSLDMERIELLRSVLAALGELPQVDRRAVSLRFLDGLAFVDVARELGVSEPAARQRVYRALETMRKDLDVRHGGRAGWATPLATFARVSSKSALVAAMPIALGAIGCIALAVVGIGRLNSSAELSNPDALEVMAADSVAAGPGPTAVTSVDRTRHSLGSSSSDSSGMDPKTVEAGALPLRSTDSPHSIRIVESTSRAPIRNADVAFVLPNVAPFVTRSDRRGVCELAFSSSEDVIASGVWVAVIDGYVPLLAQAVEAGAELCVPRAPVITGRILSAQGRPLPDVELALIVEVIDGEDDYDAVDARDDERFGALERVLGKEFVGQSAWLRRVTTDPGGDFRIDAHPAAAGIDLFAMHPKHGWKQIRIDSNARESGVRFEEIELGEVRMPRLPMFSGRVVDSDSQPISGALVRQIIDDDEPLMSGLTAETFSSTDGRFELVVSEELEPQLLVDAPGFAYELFELQFDRNGRNVLLHKSSRSKRAERDDLVLEPAREQVLQIFGPDSTPAPDILVELAPFGESRAELEFTSDAHGIVHLHRLGSDPIELLLKRTALASDAPAEFVAGGVPLIINLLPPTTVSGVVFDAETDQPLDDFSIELLRVADTEARIDGFEYVRLDGGRFSSEQTLDFSLRLRASASGYAATESRLIELGSGATEVRLGLRPRL